MTRFVQEKATLSMAQPSPTSRPSPTSPQSSTSRQGRQLLSRPERQAAILEGAAQAFAERGYAGTSMEAVAAASGITKLIVYRHFASKDDLYRAVLDHTYQALAAEFRDAIGRADPSPGVVAVLRVARRQPDAIRLLLVHAPREPEFAEYVDEVRARAVNAILSGMGRARDPVFRRWSAQVAVSYVFDAVLSWLDAGDPERDDAFVARASAGLRAMIEAWRREAEQSASGSESATPRG